MLFNISLERTMAIDVILFIVALTLFQLSRRTSEKGNRRRQMYCNALMLFCVEIVFRIFGGFLSGHTGTVPEMLHHIQQILCLSIAPFIFIILYCIDNKTEKKTIEWLLIAACANILLLVININIGYIYKIGRFNLIIHKSWYALEPIFYVVFCFIVACLTLNNVRHRAQHDKFLLRLIFTVPIIGAILGVIFDMQIVWVSILISLVYCYLYMREKDFKKDILTGMFTRSILKDDLEDIDNSRNLKSVHIGVFDLNNFKTINDTCGHTVGDEVLTAAADMLKAAYSHCSRLYRSGGDEFCLIAYDVNNSEIYRSTAELDRLIEEWNKQSEHKIAIARGFATYDPTKATTGIMQYYIKADNRMYENKKLQKSNSK